MNAEQFKAWFEGFSDSMGLGEVPSLAQWRTLKSRVESLGAAPQKEIQGRKPSVEIMEVSPGLLDSFLRSLQDKPLKKTQEKGDLSKVAGIRPSFGFPLKGYDEDVTWSGTGESFDIDHPFQTDIDDEGITAYDGRDFGLPNGTVFEVHTEPGEGVEEAIKRLGDILKARHSPKKDDKKLH